MEETTQQDTSRKRKVSRFIDTYVAQCGKCDKWRSIESQEEYEEIRSEALNKSFECKKSCEEVGDIDVESDSTRVWFEDSLHGLPKTPQGLRRILVLRGRGDRADVYYLTPQGKRLRSCREVADFIRDKESFRGTNMDDICFAKPKVMKNKTKLEDVSGDESSTGAGDYYNKKDDQKMEELHSLEIHLPLGSGEKKSEAETHTLDTSDNKPLSDVEVSIEQDKESADTEGVEKHVPESFEKEKQATERKKRKRNRRKKTLKRKKQAMGDVEEVSKKKQDDGEGKHMCESIRKEKQATDKGIESFKRKRRKETSKRKKQAVDKERNIEKEASTLDSNEVIIEEIKKGKMNGKIAVKGEKVSIHYTGKFKDTGELFESNLEEAPLRFRLGGEKVIKGLSIGVEGMRVGEKRRLIIPPSLGYSKEGLKEAVPGNMWLIYEVEAVKVG